MIDLQDYKKNLYQVILIRVGVFFINFWSQKQCGKYCFISSSFELFWIL